MNAIEISHLTKTYRDVRAVDDLTLTIPQGELFALLGVNGAGKSTTIKMLSTLTRPSVGEALVCGYSVVSQPGEVKKRIGVCPQETAVAPNLTVEENLKLLCGLYGFPREKQARQVEALMARFHLEKVSRKAAGKLSGGWQRRLSIAMALVGEPEVLFLDEPTLGLDVLARGELWQSIRQLEGKTTIILTTHYLEEAQALAHRVGVMAGGRIRALGTAEALMARTGKPTFEEAFVALVQEERL